MIKKSFQKKYILWGISFVFLLFVTIFGVTYAFFNYTRTGDTNSISTGTIIFDYSDDTSIAIGNVFPIEDDDIDEKMNKSFSISAHTTYDKGLVYRIYAVYGDEEANKTRLTDNVMTFEFIPPLNGDGFTTTSNNYSEPKSLEFVDGKALISTGKVKNTQAITTKNYSMNLWVDSSKIFISSTIKRANNEEGNPSLADVSTGTVTANRYIKNDENLEMTTLYPAKSNQEGKIIYTTKEFSTGYYSIKIVVEAEEAVE